MGGNVKIDNFEATRIDLSKINRNEVTKYVLESLYSINQTFYECNSIPLWNTTLFEKRLFFSGSSLHLFDMSISDNEFFEVKPIVGDIDVQVDLNVEPLLKSFLTENKGKEFRLLTLIGIKSSSRQLITLWKLKNHDINLQIDFEFVEFDSNGEPTTWGQFSHSSAWVDLKQGVKGVAHKYLMRALDAPRLKEVVIKPKTSRGKYKKILSSDTAFSVLYGVRKKIAPVIDDGTNIFTQNGLPVYRKLTTKESPGSTDLEYIFTHYFRAKPTLIDIELMFSFTGLLDLIKKNLPRDDWDKIALGFAFTLWGENAQGLYRDDPCTDRLEKINMMRVLCDKLEIDLSKFEPLLTKYYEVYK